MLIEGKFFDFFNQYVELVVKCVKEMVVLMINFDDFEICVYVIEVVEKEVDKVMYNVIELLYKIFIMLLDCDDIYQLIICMDDILDLFEDVVQIIFFYDIKVIMLEVKCLVELCLFCVEKV